MKRTPWFNADVLPVHAGRYEWQCNNVSMGIQQAFFNGVRWWTRTDFEPTATCKHCQWRGLLRPAKEQQK
jgi:hypothetical protein